jgi:hypothetical protein
MRGSAARNSGSNKAGMDGVTSTVGSKKRCVERTIAHKLNCKREVYRVLQSVLSAIAETRKPKL